MPKAKPPVKRIALLQPRSGETSYCPSAFLLLFIRGRNIGIRVSSNLYLSANLKVLVSLKSNCGSLIFSGAFFIHTLSSVILVLGTVMQFIYYLYAPTARGYHPVIQAGKKIAGCNAQSICFVFPGVQTYPFLDRPQPLNVIQENGLNVFLPCGWWLYCVCRFRFSTAICLCSPTPINRTSNAFLGSFIY